MPLDCGEHDDGDDHGHSQHFAWLLNTNALGPKALVPLLLTIVLSVHSFIAGMALGVQESSAAAVPTLIAIVAHKWVEAISLGVSVVRVTPDRKTLLRCATTATSQITLKYSYKDATHHCNKHPARLMPPPSVLVVFAAMSPLGIFAGWALDVLTTGMLQALVTAGPSLRRASLSSSVTRHIATSPHRHSVRHLRLCRPR